MFSSNILQITNLKVTQQWNEVDHSCLRFVRDIVKDQSNKEIIIPLTAGSVTCSFSRLVIEMRIFSSTTFFDSSATLKILIIEEH